MAFSAFVRAPDRRMVSSDALFEVCQHECAARRRGVDGFFQNADLVRLVACTRRTHDAFGGFGLRRGLDPHNTVAGATLVDILCMSASNPNTLSRVVALRIAASGAQMHPRIGRYLAPPHAAELAESAPHIAGPYVNLQNLASFARDYVDGTRAIATTVEDHHAAVVADVVSALRIARQLPLETPATLVTELGDRVLYMDISACVTTRKGVEELLSAVRLTGRAHIGPSELSGLASCTAHNLRTAARAALVDVETLFRRIGPLGASPILFYMSHKRCLVPQSPPPDDVLDMVYDSDKLALVRLGVWPMGDFESVEALRFEDPAMVVQAAIAYDVPRHWLLENALRVACPTARVNALGVDSDDDIDEVGSRALDPSRANLLRWPMVAAWGADGAPLCDLAAMFGGCTAAFIEAVRGSCVDVGGSLATFFVELAETVHVAGTPRGRERHLLATAARAAASVCANAIALTCRFRASDVRDAFGGTPIGRALVSGIVGAERVDPLALVVDGDVGNVSTTDLVLMHRRMNARAESAIAIARRGARFEIVGAARALGLRVVSLVEEAGCQSCTSRQLLAACRLVAGRSGGRGRGARAALDAYRRPTTPATQRRGAAVVALVRAVRESARARDDGGCGDVDVDADTRRRVRELIPMEFSMQIRAAFLAHL